MQMREEKKNLLERRGRAMIDEGKDVVKFPILIPNTSYMLAPESQGPESGEPQHSFLHNNKTYVLWHEPQTM